jgi:enamine deaminase RidA (YjgF/YER057c/UK114 family)
MEKARAAADHTATLAESLGFPTVIRAGDTVYVGACTAPTGENIEIQTARSFEMLVARLERAGARMSDLVNLRTYYIYSGAEGRDVTDYWERMTAVRLRYIADPGPAATALRVIGIPTSQALVGADGIASLNTDKQRIMPIHSWDWSIPVPLSQGWRIGDKILVGGQISADRQGVATAVGNPSQQARNALEYIHHILQDGGHSWSDLVALRICCEHSGDAAVARQHLDGIIQTVCQVIPEPRPALTVLGVNLLYEGLVLEIDAVSSRCQIAAVTAPPAGLVKATAGFPAATVTGDEMYVGGLSTCEGSSCIAQARLTLRGLKEIMARCRFDISDLVKLTLLFAPEDEPISHESVHAAVVQLIRAELPTARPVLTLLGVVGFARAGQYFELDGIAVRGRERQSF